MGLLSFYNLVFKFNSIKVKVALVEALAVSITSIVAIVPWKGSGMAFTDTTLIFTPILCLMVSFNVSSFTNIHLSTTMVLGTLVGSLYCYLILLITNNVIWITFITTFFVFYFVTAISNIPGRKWMTGLFLKKMFLDIFIILYFTLVENIRNDIAENIYSILFVMASIVFCSVLFPTLASRLIFGKVVKTMNSTRQYFLLIGNLFQEKIYVLESGDCTQFEIDGRSGNSAVIKKPTFNQTFEQIENQLIKEQQIKVSQGELGGKPSLTVSFKQQPSIPNSTQEMPINLTPLLNSNSLLDGHHTLGQEEKLKLPLSRSKLKDKGSAITLDIGNHRTRETMGGEMKNFQTTNQISTPSRKKSILSTPNLTKKISIIKSSGLQKSEQDLQILEAELSCRINTMNNLFVESKMERWNDDLNVNYNILISMFGTTLKQLVSIKASIKSGFSQISGQELLTPLIPFIECLIDEVYLQMGIMVDILNHKDEDLKDGSTYSLLSKSFDETLDLVNRVKGAFKHVVNEYQKGGNELLSHDEVTKTHFLVHGVLSFALQQREFADLLIKVKKLQRTQSVRWELIRHGLLFVVAGFPLFFLKRFKFFKNKIFSFTSTQTSDIENEKETPNENNFILLLKWIKFNFFQDGKWRFPLQHAVAMMSAIIPFYYFDGFTDSSGKFITFGVWSVTTILFIIGPCLGASITKGFQESKGTMFGAVFGFLSSLLCSAIPNPWKEIVVIIIIFIFFFFISFPHQNAYHSQAAEICGLTFLLLLLGQNLTQDFDYMYVVLRILHILFGVFWNAFICLVVFPYFTYKGTRITIFKTTISMSEIFIKIIEYGLRMNESIVGNKDLEIFNHDGDDFQQSKDIIQKRQDTIIKTLLEHKDDLTNNHNRVDNINNIIRIPTNQGTKIQLKRIKMKKEIFESLNQIRDSIDTVKNSLVDVKSEMYFVSPTKITKYISITEHLNDCSTTLTALENSFDPIFSDLLIIAMFDLVKPLQDLFQQLKKSNLDLKSTMQGKFKNDDVFQHCDLIKEKWLSYQQHFKSNRLFLLNEKVFHLLHPEQIQFGSGVFTIEMFIESFVSLINDLRSIRDETSYLKQFLKLK